MDGFMVRVAIVFKMKPLMLRPAKNAQIKAFF